LGWPDVYENVKGTTMDQNLAIAKAYLDMLEGWKKGKTKRESWVPEAIADEDVADFMGAAAAAAKAGKKEFKFGDKTYKVTMKKTTADAIDEANLCEKCGKVHEGSCNEEVQEEADDDLAEDLEENNSDKYMWKDINAALMKAGMNPPQIMKVLSGLKGKALKEEALDEVTKDTDELEPRAKGEKDFKKMHDDNTEIHDEEKNDEENFKNIKKSADAIKK
jgi:hypothetical protein